MVISWRLAAPSVAALLSLLTGCSNEPSVEMVEWSISPVEGKKDTYRFVATAQLENGVGGWFGSQLLMTDERGCKIPQYTGLVNPINMPDPSDVAGRYDETFEHAWPIADAQLVINYTTPEGGGFAETPIFTDHKVIDPALSPPSIPEVSCDSGKRPTREELRERAKTDPEGADAAAIDNMPNKELLATAINSAGFLCAKIIDAEARGNMIIARCVEYRNGSGRVRYSIDLGDMTVTKL